MMVVGSNPFRFRILRLSDPNRFRKPNRKHANQCSFRCEIFYSEAWSWKQLEEIYLPYDVILSHQAAVSVCGVFHWLTSANDIFAFHAGNETWRMLSLPDGINSEKYLLKLSEYEGKLALVCVERGRDDCFDLWVMEVYYREKEWRKRRTVSTKPVQREEPYVTPSPEALCNADVAMMSSYNRVYFYKFMDGSSYAVNLENFFDSHGVFCFQSDV
ncbi:F-box protein [Melia azedarach]|uniref:F-box protein n=1 Tax=Melia azedarach TaxID=155640 RepID=A0ACC1XCF9_MELAZ|nr:F-box protein [Melia azedarach]